MNLVRPVPAGAVVLAPEPLRDLAPAGRQRFWRSLGDAPLLLLSGDLAAWSNGWVLVRGFLHAESREATYLCIELVDGRLVHVKTPVTARGKIQEVIWLPPGSRRLLLQPVSCPGEFELAELSLQPLDWFRSFFRRAWRVRKTQKKHPRRLLRRMGWPRLGPWLNVPRAYEVANALRDHIPHTSYARYLATVDALSHEDRKRIARHIRNFAYSPRFHILLACAQAEAPAAQDTLMSLQRQLYGNFKVQADGELPQGVPPRQEWTFELALPARKGEPWRLATAQNIGHKPAWVILLRAGEQLAETALYWLATEILAHPQAEFVYTDHDHLDTDGARHAPIFKPDWSPELLRSANYIGPAATVREDTLARIPDTGAKSPDSRHELWLRVLHAMPGTAIRHVPAVLWHLPPHPDPHRLAAQADLAAVRQHLSDIGVMAQVQPSRHGLCHVRYAMPDPAALVSIIIPTRDGLALLRPCLESVLHRSSYPRIEVIIVDNGSQDEATLAYLAQAAQDSRVRVIRDNAPFNYSALNNHAVRIASGEAICLLNNDTEVITPDWLEEMMGHLVQPGVGVVGAKLYYGDGRVQHAGDAVGPGGCADHMHSKLERDAPGYAGRAVLAQDLSAVTAACLLTWRQLYLDLGGLNEVELPISFNDVDYCLRAREAGHRVVWTPHAELFHYESITRGQDISPEQQARSRREADYMRRRWAAAMRHEPFYNPNLSYDRPDFTLNPAPALRRPWEKQ
ncbi:glycosyltransferase family 2 protein [Orrella sp. JC864]|uniref:glycosyltransferase family 2 protein n=1 Tax=Orrella sp. JC864 TaxID=3120298 RepID=UPI00300965D3